MAASREVCEAVAVVLRTTRCIGWVCAVACGGEGHLASFAAGVQSLAVVAHAPSLAVLFLFYVFVFVCVHQFSRQNVVS